VVIVLEVDLPGEDAPARARSVEQADELLCITGAVADAVETACLDVPAAAATGLPDVLPATGGGAPPGPARWIALAGLGCAAALLAGLRAIRPGR
jgi:hypothetical protein